MTAKNVISPSSVEFKMIPPLNNGDHLSRVEFERRYEAYPDVKAELIEGVVYMLSPVRVKQHGKPHSRIMVWLGTYQAHTTGVDFADNATLRVDWDNEPQPDAVMWLSETAGGKAQIAEDDYLVGAPELIVEIAVSTVAYDLHEKKEVYRRNGVQEYLVLTIYEQKTHWFTLDEGEYKLLSADENGVLKSQVFPGLWFHPALFWEDQMSDLLALLQQGLASPDHQAFQTSLQL